MSVAARARPLLPFVVAAAIALVAIAAIATPRVHTDRSDPNDTRGVLDIRRIRLDHRGSTEATIITFAPWTIRSIWDRGFAYVFLDTQGDEAAEYFVLARSKGNELDATLWRDRRTRRDVLIRKVQVRRKSDYGVTVALPIRSLQFGPNRDSYFWWTVTTFMGARCRRTCIDLAPNNGTLEQWSPGASPTTTTTTTAPPPDP